MLLTDFFFKRSLRRMYSGPAKHVLLQLLRVVVCVCASVRVHRIASEQPARHERQDSHTCIRALRTKRCTRMPALAV